MISLFFFFSLMMGWFECSLQVYGLMEGNFYRQAYWQWISHTFWFGSCIISARICTIRGGLSGCKHFWGSCKPCCHIWCIPWWQHNSFEGNFVLDCAADGIGCCLLVAQVCHWRIGKELVIDQWLANLLACIVRLEIEKFLDVNYLCTNLTFYRKQQHSLYLLVFLYGTLWCSR